jgi:ABC-type oligopeptide transport system substrate-binding subunit
VVLKAYDDYWGGPDNINLPPAGKKRIETIEKHYVASLTTRLLDLRQGKATGIQLTEADLFQAIDRDKWLNEGVIESIIPGVTVHGPIPTFNCWWLNFNTNVTLPDGSFKSFQPFADWRFRKAVASAVNITYVNTYVNNRFGVVANTIVPPGVFPEGSYNPNVKPAFELDLALAEEMITDLYENPMTSATHDMYYYDGTKIPAGVVDNSFSRTNPKVVELYVQTGASAFEQICTTIVENLNSIATRITGHRLGLHFRVVLVPGGHQYTLASRHQVDAFMGGWISDYNHIINWLQPMYYSRGTYPSWNRWNVTALDDLYAQALEADEQGDFTKLVEISDQMNQIANEHLLYMVWWHDTEQPTRSSWLQGWYMNPVYGVDLWSNMWYEEPS